MSHALPIGTRLQDDKITILSVLGSGGFGITYKARHTFQGEIALKEMFISGQSRFCTRDETTHRVKPNAALVPDYAYFTKLFKDEANTLNKFGKVEGVVNVLDIFKENDTIYIVMQYVAGDSLKQLVTKRGTLPVHEVKQYAAQLCAALTAVHAADVIHRDIAPDNILLTPEGKPILIDFGIARTFIDGVTITHSAFIKPGFSAPEQEVERAQRGAYTDIYSLAATLFYCLTAERPASTTERTIMRYRSAHEYNPAVPLDLSAVLDKALSVKPIDRYPSAAQFAAALNDVTVVDDGTQVGEVQNLSDLEAAKVAAAKKAAEDAKQKSAAAHNNVGEVKNLPDVQPSKNYKPLLAFLAAAVVGAGGYMAYNKTPSEMPVPEPIDPILVVDSPSVIPPNKPTPTISGASTAPIQQPIPEFNTENLLDEESYSSLKRKNGYGSWVSDKCEGIITEVDNKNQIYEVYVNKTSVIGPTSQIHNKIWIVLHFLSGARQPLGKARLNQLNTILVVGSKISFAYTEEGTAPSRFFAYINCL